MSLRATIAVSLALLVGAVAAVIGLRSIDATTDALRDEIDRSVELAAARWIRFPRMPPMERRVDDGRGGVALQLLAADGTPLNAVGAELPVDDVDRALAAGERTGAVRRDVEVGGDPYRLLTVPLVRGGAVQAARDLTEAERVVDRLRTRILVTSVVAAAVAALVGWGLAYGATRRLTRLTAAAEEVTTTGRLDVPVPVRGSDETGRLGQAFNRMLEALRGSRDAQQRLVQDAGHELRTPLTSLRTNVDVLRRHPTLPEAERVRVLEDLDREARELTALVNELVELATDRRTEEEPAPVDLGALARRVAARTERRTGRTVLVTSDTTVVEGRHALLERAIANLLDNAAKFDPSGGPLELDVRQGRVEVRDRGPGIAPEDLPFVFDRFHRAVTARSLPGSGLGLSIVKDVAAAHGGTVFAAARPGGGAVVGFTVDTTPTAL